MKTVRVKMSPQEEEDYEVSVPVETENEEEERGDRRSFIIELASHIFFSIASILYVWLAAIELDYGKNIKHVPSYVLEVDDWDSWEPYYFGDDYVFLTPNSDYWVSKYQILYFLAALGFVFVGILDLFIYPKFLGVCMILAGSFGVISAIFVESDEDLSNIFNMVSVHLFCLEAVAIFYKRSFFGGLKVLLRIGDFFFIAGTLVDVILSWLYWADRFNVTLARVEIFAAVCWLVTAVIYVGTTIYIHMHDGHDSTVANEGGKRGYGKWSNTTQYSDETASGEEP